MIYIMHENIAVILNLCVSSKNVMSAPPLRVVKLSFFCLMCCV